MTREIPIFVQKLQFFFSFFRRDISETFSRNKYNLKLSKINQNFRKFMRIDKTLNMLSKNFNFCKIKKKYAHLYFLLNLKHFKYYELKI